MAFASKGFVAQIGWRADFPFALKDLPDSLCCGYAKSGVAVEHGETGLDFRGLPVEVSRREALPQQFHAMHPFVGKMIPPIIF
tara:strand:+ start:250 stop:498 length:249 start_codon:yes stop_codon:yes gene_type:complete